jgi:hypothetical protein
MDWDNKSHIEQRDTYLCTKGYLKVNKEIPRLIRNDSILFIRFNVSTPL